MSVAWMIAKDLDLTEVEEGFIAYDAEEDRVHYLNGVAALVYVLCDQPRSVDELASLVREHFALESSPDDDIGVVLESFQREGLLERAPL